MEAMGRQYSEKDVQDLVGYIQQLESNLSKKDEIIAAKDRRIAALEAHELSVPSTGSNAAFDPKQLSKEARKPVKGKTATTNEVSDDSCDAESDYSSFGSLGLSFLRNDSSNDEDSMADASDGRWNIPFDDSNDEDLVPKSSMQTLPHPTALSDIGFKSIEGDGDDSGLADGFAALHVTSTVQPTITHAAAVGTLPFRNPNISPIVRAVRRGLSRVDSDGSDKENVDPIRKRLSVGKCTLSQGFSSPCR